jgi:hypothetical protein
MLVANWGKPFGKRPQHYHTDNSLSQFGLLGLWVAQRRGAPVGPALTRVARHFRATQAGDGSWAYQTPGQRSRPSNTCSGLMGLAVGHGLGAGRTPIQDGALAKALDFLGRAIDRAAALPRGQGRMSGVECVNDLYFFWSLERMAMVYGLRVVGATEWYPWAAERIVDAQQADGSWRSVYPWPVDTCFALLVLRRTNLAPDLTATLRGRIRGQDPLPPLRPVIGRPQGAPAGTTTRPPAPQPAPERRGELTDGVTEKRAPK